MFHLILVVHIALCVMMVALVLLQQGKGADAGIALGGSANSLFGATGASSIITKLTTGIAISFMVTSVLLVRNFNARDVLDVMATPSDPLTGSVVVDAPPVAVPEEVPAAVAPSAASVVPEAAAPVASAVEPAVPVTLPTAGKTSP